MSRSLLFLAKAVGCFLGALLPLLAHAFEPFRITAIEVEGNQHIDKSVVLGLLPVSTGTLFTEEISNHTIRTLYASGFFKRLRLEANAGTLVIHVLERPAVSTIDFIGVSKSEQEGLLRGLRGIGLVEGRPFDLSQLYKAEQEIRRQYLARGLYATYVRADATPLERNRIKVTLIVREGEAARIDNINIIGNDVYSESTLLSQFNLAPPNWLTWYTGSDKYSRQKLAADLDILRAYYQDSGYAEMEVNSTLVSINTSKEKFAITVNITEGERYTMGDLRLEGNLLGIDAELRELITVKAGEVYSASRITAVQRAISQRLSEVGYAFSNVTAIPAINRQAKVIAITFTVNPGKRVYVRRINITGNSKTRDHVIRRELRQFENAWFDARKINLSRDRINRLGFFADVQVDTREVPGTTDQVDLNIQVTEKFTGSISGGVGYSTTDGASLLLSLEQPNMFGTGEYLGLQINTAQRSRTYSVVSTDPYFTKYGVSRTIDLTSKTNIPPLGSVTNYTLNTNRAGLGFGVPYNETSRVSLGIAVEQIELVTDNTSPVTYLAYVNQFGSNNSVTTYNYPLTLGWQRDGRDNSLIPSRGTYQSLSYEFSDFGNLHYSQVGYNLQAYYPVSDGLTAASNFQVNVGRAIGNSSYPVFKNFYLGGVGSVRGYSASSIGPSGVVQSQNIGGRARSFFNLELLGHFPGAGKDRSIRWNLFFDGGGVYESPRSLFQDMRYAYGAGLVWLSPVGPLKFSLGYAINPRPEDVPQTLQFQFGSNF